MYKSTLFLDIDQTSFYGHDGNDIPGCLQIDNKVGIIPGVMSLLVNPAMIDAVREIEGKLGTSRIVLYTAKYDLPSYMPADSRFLVDPGHIYFPAHTQMHDLPIFAQRTEYFAFKRLFHVRDAICAHLDRTSIEVVVTSCPGKCVVSTCGKLSPPAEPENAFLFDDRVDLAGQYHVITVPVFNTVTEECKDALYALVGSHKLSERAAGFAATAPEGHSCLGEMNRINVNWSKDVPQRWSLSFLESIECVVFRFADLWDDGEDPLCDDILGAGFDLHSA